MPQYLMSVGTTTTTTSTSPAPTRSAWSPRSPPSTQSSKLLAPGVFEAAYSASSATVVRSSGGAGR